MKKWIILLIILFILQFIVSVFSQTGTQKPKLILQTSHLSPAQALSFSLDGKLLASGGFDNTIKLWNSASGRLINNFVGHSDKINAVAFKPGENILSSGSDDKTIRLWDIINGKEILTIKENITAINSLAFSFDGKTLASGGEDGTIKLWNAETGKEITSLSKHASAVDCLLFEKSGNFLISASSNATINDSTIKLWNLKDGTEIRQFLGHSEPISSIILSANEKFLISSSNDSTIKMWDIDKGTEVNSFSLDFPRGFSTAFSSTGYFASASIEGEVILFDMGKGKIFRRNDKEGMFAFKLIFSHDGKKLASSDMAATIKIWDLDSNLSYIVGGKRTLTISSLGFSPDGKTLASVNGVSRINLWNIENTESSNLLKSFPNTSLPNKPQVPSELGMLYAVFSPNGKTLATVNMLNKNIDLWSIESEEKLRSLKGHSAEITILSFNDDGSKIISRSDDNVIKIWDVESGSILKSFNETDAETQNIPKLFSGVFEGNSLKKGILKQKSFNFSSKYIAVAEGLSGSSLDKDKIVLYSRKTQKEICTLIAVDRNDWIIITPEGRFDTNKDFTYINVLHWILPDMPLMPVPFEVFMRDYYEPNLLPRLLKCTEENNCSQELKPVRNLTELNRTQPKVQIAEIKATDSVDVVQVTVEAEDVVSEFQKDKQGDFLRSGVEDLRLFRDGQLVGYTPDREGAVGNDKAGKFSKTFNVKLPKNRDVTEFNFTAYAFNSDRVKSETASRTYVLPQKLTKVPGNAYLVTIGVNANENRSYNLRYAANDARKLQEELQKHLPKNKYEKIVQMPLISDYDKDGNLTENNATKQKIKAVLDKLAGRTISNDALKDVPNANLLEKVQPEDLVLIAFSGHGYADREGIFYLVPYDIGMKNSGGFESIKQKTVSSDELSLWLRDIDAGEMMMIVDACHSAAAVQGKDFKPGPMGARGLGQLSYDKGMRILTATQADNVALELGNLQHGLLTYSLVKNGIELGLADYQPKDNKLFSNEWLSFAVKDVPLLYEKAAKEGLKNLFVNGKPKSDVINLEGQKSNLNLQRPLLFDFNRRNRDYDLFPSIGRINQSLDRSNEKSAEEWEKTETNNCGSANGSTMLFEQVPFFQLEAMKQQRIDLRNGASVVKGKGDIIYIAANPR